MNILKSVMLPGAAVIVLAGCVSSGVFVGDKPDAVPPRLQVGADKSLSWDRPSAFGPVPAQLQATGDRICKSAGATRAIGYHPNAQNEKGQRFDGGGYFCS